jgi:hypothetical protein
MTQAFILPDNAGYVYHGQVYTSLDAISNVVQTFWPGETLTVRLCPPDAAAYWINQINAGKQRLN